MNIKTFLRPKTNISTTTTTVGKNVIVSSGAGTTTVNGQEITPSKITTGDITANNITAGNIEVNNKISATTLSAVNIIGSSMSIDNLNVSSIGTDAIYTGTVDASQHSYFRNGLTSYGSSYFSYIYSDNITNNDTIKTKDLVVTGQAHFFELVIDKVKASGGAVLITPADGFVVDKVESITEFPDEERGTTTMGSFYKVYWRMDEEPYTSSQNSGLGRQNMWERDDQAICRSFNRLQGNNVSNKYYWAHVVYVSQAPEVITLNNNSYRANYIIIDRAEGTYDGTLNIEVGDEIAMLGHKDDGLTDHSDRQAAIYISAGQSLDPEIDAPLIAHYQGINDYNLSSHRQSYFDKDSAQFIGDFKVKTGTTNTGLEDYIKGIVDDNTSPVRLNVQTTSYSEVNNIIVQADANSYIGYTTDLTEIGFVNSLYLMTTPRATTVNSMTMRLFGISYDIKAIAEGQPFPITTTAPIVVSTVTQLSDRYLIRFVYNGNAGSSMKIDNTTMSFNGSVTYNGQSYSLFRDIQINVLKNVKGVDTELYSLYKDKEKVYVDSDGYLNVDLKYELQRTVGATTTFVKPAQANKKLIIYLNYYDGSSSTATPNWTDNGGTGGLGYYYFTPSRSSWYGAADNKKLLYIDVRLVDNDGSGVYTSEIIYVKNEPTSLFTVTDDAITQAVSSANTYTDNMSSYFNTKYGELLVADDRIRSTVSSLSSTVSGNDAWTRQQFSYIETTATGISARVNTLDQGLKSTGIDIVNGEITIDADKLIVEGDQELHGKFVSENKEKMNKITLDVDHGGFVMRGPSAVDERDPEMPQEGATPEDIFRIDFGTEHTADENSRFGMMQILNAGNANRFILANAGDVEIKMSNGADTLYIWPNSLQMNGLQIEFSTLYNIIVYYLDNRPEDIIRRNYTSDSQATAAGLKVGDIYHKDGTLRIVRS